jgi:hypothetical protein
MKYDPNEYQQISDIRTHASYYKNSCDNELMSITNAVALATETARFKNYTQYLPHNDKTANSAVELDKIAQGLDTQYRNAKVSPAFCKIKFGMVEKSAEDIQKIVGNKPR